MLNENFKINRTLAYEMQKDAKSNERKEKEARKLKRKEESQKWNKPKANKK